MAKRGLRHRVLRIATVIAVGGSAFQLSSCDPAVRDTVLSGLQTTTQSLADTLIQAFFTSLQDSETGSGTLTTT